MSSGLSPVTRLPTPTCPLPQAGSRWQCWLPWWQAWPLAPGHHWDGGGHGVIMVVNTVFHCCGTDHGNDHGDDVQHLDGDDHEVCGSHGYDYYYRECGNYHESCDNEDGGDHGECGNVGGGVDCGEDGGQGNGGYHEYGGDLWLSCQWLCLL